MQMQVAGVDLRDAPENYSSWIVDAKELEDLGELFLFFRFSRVFVLGGKTTISRLLRLRVSGFTRA